LGLNIPTRGNWGDPAVKKSGEKRGAKKRDGEGGKKKLETHVKDKQEQGSSHRPRGGGHLGGIK